jgi:hypothetical protein
MKILQNETRTAMEENKEAHQEPHKICRNNRKEYEEVKLQLVQTYNTTSASTEFYQKSEDLQKDACHNQQYAKTKEAIW